MAHTHDKEDPIRMMAYTSKSGVSHWWFTIGERFHFCLSSRPVWGFSLGRRWFTPSGCLGFAKGVTLDFGYLTTHMIYGQKFFDGIDVNGKGCGITTTWKNPWRVGATQCGVRFKGGVMKDGR